MSVFTRNSSARENGRLNGGGGGIRTLEALSSLAVFKTAAFNRSATPPLGSVQVARAGLQSRCVAQMRAAHGGLHAIFARNYKQVIEADFSSAVRG
jgi:hypothetical protein